MLKLTTPLTKEDVAGLEPGDMVLLCGDVYAGRDAVLPKIVAAADAGELSAAVPLEGGVVFHTAVSPAGVGPTSSNKVEIEESIVPLSRHGVRLHLGKGRIGAKTIEGMCAEGSAFAVIPPVTALLEERTARRELVAFPELGMEAFYKLESQGYPCVIAAVNGKSIFDE